MNFKSFIKLMGMVIIQLILIVFLLSCASGPYKYSLTGSPTEQTKSFKGIEVDKVEVGITESELDLETPIELRTAIIDEVQKTGKYAKVAPELTSEEGVIQIESKIVEFDEGSQGARWIGFGMGKAHLDVICQFKNKKTGEVFATGTFIGEIKGGWFGGTANQKKMSEYVAKAVAKFLKKGK